MIIWEECEGEKKYWMCKHCGQVYETEPWEHYLPEKRCEVLCVMNPRKQGYRDHEWFQVDYDCYKKNIHKTNFSRQSFEASHAYLSGSRSNAAVQKYKEYRDAITYAKRRKHASMRFVERRKLQEELSKMTDRELKIYILKVKVKSFFIKYRFYLKLFFILAVVIVSVFAYFCFLNN
jgi:hypothetical protein